MSSSGSPTATASPTPAHPRMVRRWRASRARSACAAAAPGASRPGSCAPTIATAPIHAGTRMPSASGWPAMSEGRCARAALILVLLAPVSRGGDWMGPLSTVNEPLIAGREVQLDARGRLLPWPFADDPGRSYDAHVRSQWALLRGLFERMPYFHCCFQIDPVSFEPVADRNWV